VLVRQHSQASGNTTPILLALSTVFHTRLVKQAE
jgi:hypothetical protein